MLRRKRRREEVATDEVNLIPVMNLFVCLIPFLLLTAAFVRLGAVEAELPKASSSLDPKKDVELKDKEVDLIFQMDRNEVIVTAFTDNFQTPVDHVRGVFVSTQTSELREFLTELSVRFEKLNSSIFKAGSQTRFEDAIRVLSVLRQHEKIKSVVLATEVVN